MKHGPVSMNTELIYPGRNRRKTTHEALPQQLSVSPFLVFIAVRLEKLTLHIYVVENGSNVKIALFAKMGNFLALIHDLVSVQLVPPAPVVMSFPPTDAELFCIFHVNLATYEKKNIHSKYNIN